VFSASEPGEYRFCLDNTISTFADKVVDFDITVGGPAAAWSKTQLGQTLITLQVENEGVAQLPQKAGASPEQVGSVEESITKLSGQVSTLTRQQKYFRTRENRNFSTVRSTEARIFKLNLIETGLMIAMAALQVFVVKMFFTGGRKGKFLRILASQTNANIVFQVTFDTARWSLY
jgi:hypothetical protein